MAGIGKLPGKQGTNRLSVRILQEGNEKEIYKVCRDGKDMAAWWLG